MLQKRLIELSGIAYNRGIVTFSDFLNLNELNILHTTPKNQFLSQYKTYGGYDLSERQMAAFLPDALYYDFQYPIQIIEISPVNKRFAEVLTHRDYLGAVMNLGIDRCKMGDIIVEDEKALLFVKEEMAAYIAEHLTQIRHTSVRCSIFTGKAEALQPEKIKREYQVASERVDGVAAKVFGLSRAQILEIFRQKHVFVNGRLQESNSAPLKAGDRVTVRGYGKFVYGGVTHMTKKGKCGIVVELFS